MSCSIRAASLEHACRGSGSLEGRGGHWGVCSGRQSLGEGMKARKVFVPTTEPSGPRIPGPHCDHKFTYSRPTLHQKVCLVSAYLCLHSWVYTVTFYEVTFSPTSTYPLRLSSGATLSIKPVLFPCIECQSSFFCVYFMAVSSKHAYVSYVKLSLTPSPSIASGLSFQIYQSWQSKQTILESLLFAIHC